MFDKVKYWVSDHKYISLGLGISFLLLCSISTAILLKRTHTSDTKQLSSQLPSSKFVSRIPGGMVNPDEPILIEFNSPVIKKESLSKSIPIDSFSITPKLKGNFEWRDLHTLVFKNTQQLPLGASFSIALNLGKAIPDNPKLSNETLSWSFTTYHREVIEATCDFEMVSENDPSKWRLKGFIQFNLKTDLELLKESTKMKMGWSSILMTWKEVIPGIKFEYRSETIIKDDEAKEIQLTISDKKLKMFNSFKQSIILEPLLQFEVDRITQSSTDGEYSIRIGFTDKLAENQDVETYINIHPEVKFNSRINNRSIELLGDFKTGTKYNVTLFEGIKSKWGIKNESKYSESVYFGDEKPKVYFLDSGVFLPRDSKLKIGFRTINLSKVRINIIQVFDNNLGQFLQTEKLSSSVDRSDKSWRTDFNRLGVTVHDQYHLIGTNKNRYLNHQLDLSHVIKNKNDMYFVTLSFQREDMLYEHHDEQNENARDYYSNPEDGGMCVNMVVFTNRF